MLSSENLIFFRVIATSRTLAAASRELDVTPSAITQRLQQLERRLNLRLIDRSGRYLRLTDEGELLAQWTQRILDDLETLDAELASRRAVVSGQLRIVAPLGFGRRYIAPAVARFRQAHPAVSLSLTLSDRPMRDTSQGFDVLIHIGELHDSSLVAQRLAPNARIVCAAPSYLGPRGTPTMPNELSAHDCIALRENEEDVTFWRFSHVSDGRTTAVRVKAAISCNDGDVVRNWGVAGAGIMVRSEWDVADSLRDGSLIQLLTDWRLPSADVMLIVGSRSGRSEKNRRFIQFLRDDLSAVPWRL